jgi:hypothetical protein
MPSPNHLFRLQELAFRTQYAELKERSSTGVPLLRVAQGLSREGGKVQAATLAAILVEQQDEALVESFGELPTVMKAVVRKRLPALRRALAGHPQALEQFEMALDSSCPKQANDRSSR